MARFPDSQVVWDPSVLDYRFSHSHPMDPVRLRLTMELSRMLGVLDGVEVVTPADFDPLELGRAHTDDYLAAVRVAGSGRSRIDLTGYGLGNDDNPIFLRMHEAAASLVGSTLTGAKAIATGHTTRAVNIAGGMHHAMRSHASGFCVYNDAAIAISWLLDNGFDRIAYIDVDAHHGDGVQAQFWNDPRVLTVSLHEDPQHLWPNTGYPTELGGPEARGTAVNIPVPAFCPDGLWLRAFHAVVPSVVREFRPQLIISQCGCDSHATDPLTDLSLTVDGQRAAILAMRDFADEVCDGRWLAVGGGGYQLVHVVPRAWTHLIAAVVGADIDPATPIPDEWKDLAASLPTDQVGAVGTLPETMGEGAATGFVPWEPSSYDPTAAPMEAAADRFIARARSAVFPLHGLDPEDPRD
ncbi:acetoin utilization protein AcuC [Tsukamurella columbiensis]|uniref:Acetoin utilization protein AcuC n=1 Tax=Tsukamurella columbiensis TaxID=128509 RepID=A0ABX1LF98_9ACTN|nr:acetoin utilization protein AcuC [Tsukamurella columbiensis]NMD56110.1 acetoin utilization protein AcuC [Tsukamurella columbiensis]